ncbi:hypothetical protein LRAMOSA09194 [Lichtheimia ramosa]|uniref:Uncharacterized protein n=1 Tax=Lichtheimia ramosa TaxID=688394 RepID=A0A077WJ91_9FUNG|nr:hypothetical protein LRAMOSA09194 [Lichtheimia ramosa]
MSEEPKTKVSKTSLQANEVLKSQIEASIGVARSLVNSWLPAPKPGEKLEDDDSDTETMNRYSTGRPDRLGLGAKFLSHAEAMKHQTQSLSKQEMQLRNKIVNQNQRANSTSTIGKRSRDQNEDDDDDDDDDDEDSRTKVVASSGKSTLRTSESKIKDAGSRDFLSMYSSGGNGNAGKKKRKRKPRSKQAKQGKEGQEA